METTDEKEKEFQEWGSSLREWGLNPTTDLGIPDYLVAAAEKAALEVAARAEQRGENIALKRLVNWPSESAITPILHTAFHLNPNYRDSLPTDENRREFLEEAAQAVWNRIIHELTSEGTTHIEDEVHTTYITQEITKVIKLEQFYTSLEPIGTIAWENSNKELRDMVTDDSLVCITESPSILISTDNPKSRRIIPNWIRGLILSFAMQSSRQGKAFIGLASKLKPEPQAFRQAAMWTLGIHLNFHGKRQYLEETVKTFTKLTHRRAKVNLNLKVMPYEAIQHEVEIPSPIGKNGEVYPWNLCWGIIPNTDLEVRELAHTWRQRRENAGNILQQYRLRFLNRAIAYICRKNVLAAYENRGSIRETFLISEGLKKPVFQYLNSRIPANNKLLFAMIYTESVWKQLCPLAKS